MEILREISTNVQRLFEECGYMQPPELMYTLDSDKIYVAPEYVINILINELRQSCMTNPIDSSLKYRGITVQPGYENKVVLFSKLYPLLKNENLICSVDVK